MRSLLFFSSVLQIVCCSDTVLYPPLSATVHYENRIPVVSFHGHPLEAADDQEEIGRVYFSTGNSFVRDEDSYSTKIDAYVSVTSQHIQESSANGNPLFEVELPPTLHQNFTFEVQLGDLTSGLLEGDRPPIDFDKEDSGLERIVKSLVTTGYNGDADPHEYFWVPVVEDFSKTDVYLVHVHPSDDTLSAEVHVLHNVSLDYFVRGVELLEDALVTVDGRGEPAKVEIRDLIEPAALSRLIDLYHHDYSTVSISGEDDVHFCYLKYSDGCSDVQFDSSGNPYNLVGSSIACMDLSNPDSTAEVVQDLFPSLTPDWKTLSSETIDALLMASTPVGNAGGCVEARDLFYVNGLECQVDEEDMVCYVTAAGQDADIVVQVKFKEEDYSPISSQLIMDTTTETYGLDNVVVVPNDEAFYKIHAALQVDVSSFFGGEILTDSECEEVVAVFSRAVESDLSGLEIGDPIPIGNAYASFVCVAEEPSVLGYITTNCFSGIFGGLEYDPPDLLVTCATSCEAPLYDLHLGIPSQLGLYNPQHVAAVTLDDLRCSDEFFYGGLPPLLVPRVQLLNFQREGIFELVEEDLRK